MCYVMQPKKKFHDNLNTRTAPAVTAVWERWRHMEQAGGGKGDICMFRMALGTNPCHPNLRSQATLRASALQ